MGGFILSSVWIPNALKSQEGPMTTRTGLLLWLIVCYAFLYLPIAFLIVFSFNDARSVTQWAGFS